VGLAGDERGAGEVAMFFGVAAGDGLAGGGSGAGGFPGVQTVGDDLGCEAIVG
jgi:hypothetical protein